VNGYYKFVISLNNEQHNLHLRLPLAWRLQTKQFFAPHSTFKLDGEEHKKSVKEEEEGGEKVAKIKSFLQCSLWLATHRWIFCSFFM
jgi:hypothetical protein